MASRAERARRRAAQRGDQSDDEYKQHVRPILSESSNLEEVCQKKRRSRVSKNSISDEVKPGRADLHKPSQKLLDLTNLELTINESTEVINRFTDLVDNHGLRVKPDAQHEYTPSLNAAQYIRDLPFHDGQNRHYILDVVNVDL